ncbi:hypothetical protein EB118_13965 [bacterium]|nr:hypothetical protein [bacterium]
MLNVICVKHGTKYTYLHVNRLYNMVSRHLTIPYRFVCFTEDSVNIDPRIQIIPLPNNEHISGWWWKTYIFAPHHFKNSETKLFFDLDMVIINNIDKFLRYKQGLFVGLEDLGRVFDKPKKIGSAVMRWQGSSYENIWTEFIKDPTQSKKFTGGDQDWIWELSKKKINFFPKEWIISYKWEARNNKELIRINNKWIFKNIAEPKIPEDTCVLAFHGTPNLEDTEDKIIVENWQ